MKCPTCGAENDPANRFCDQCGTRLDQGGGQSQEQTMVAQPVAASVCPTCGAPVLPGEAFCDNCGSALTGPAPDASATIDATTATSPAAASGPATGRTCPACGAPVEAGDAFCDNCGASLALAPTAFEDSAPIAAPLGGTTPTTGDNGKPPVDATAAPDPDAQAAPVGDSSSQSQPAVAVTTETAAPATADAAATAAAPSPAGADNATVAPNDETVAAPTGDATALAVPAPDAQAAYDTSRQQLDDEIARNQSIIAQLEGVQAMLGAGTPAGVVQSLDEARAALAKAQADRDALQPPAPAVDPAEVARLNDQLTRQQSIVTQLESVQTMLGAGTPAGVLQSLDEARAALAKAQADLQALGVSPSPVSTAPAQSQPAAAQATPAVAAPVTAVDEAQVAQPAAAPAGARLVVDDGGSELALPSDKCEYIIGREDPISGIYPEVDLTPYGGETGGVSRQHARLTRSGSQWMLTDLNSTNHTRVDGSRLEPNTPTEVKDGAKLQFGRLALTFRA
jgi:uncharacterized OB-fold protein